MTSRTTKRFRNLLADLPPHVQKQAQEIYIAWMRDPWQPNLHFKQIHATRPIFSARIGIDWRAVCLRSGDNALWYFIGSHADYNKLIKML
ncbi:MAG: hypothetical protein ABI042_05135 [Verrucomicrobiota bacterium]